MLINCTISYRPLEVHTHTHLYPLVQIVSKSAPGIIISYPNSSREETFTVITGSYPGTSPVSPGVHRLNNKENPNPTERSCFGVVASCCLIVRVEPKSFLESNMRAGCNKVAYTHLCDRKKNKKLPPKPGTKIYRFRHDSRWNFSTQFRLLPI